MAATTTRLVTALLGSALLVAVSNAAPVGWRTDGTGSYPGVSPPTVWAEDSNVLWKTKLPGRSQGSPIIVGQRIFVVSDPAELLCVNPADGAILWQRSNGLVDLYGMEKAQEIAADYQRLREEKKKLDREMGAAQGDADKQREIKQRLDALGESQRELTKDFPSPPEHAGGETTNSAATPASDGTHVYAVFGNGVVCAYTLAGERRWVKYVEFSNIGFGHSSSPALADGKLVVHFNDLFALDASTGEIAWQTALTPRHATPIVAHLDEIRVVVSPAGAVVRWDDGKVLLKDNTLSASECSAILHDGVLYKTSDNSTVAARLVSAGEDAVKLEKLWSQKTAGGRRTPSPVLHNGLFYCVNTDGILDVLNASTGEPIYKNRLDIGSVYSSAAAAGDYLFVSSTKGTTLVLAPGSEYREIARNQLECFGSNPVFSGRRMFVRTRQHLYCIGP